MAPSFGRSISFPLSPARSSSSKPRAAAAARHIRSISLPSSRAHPLLAHLQNTTRAARAWATAGESMPTSPSSGLAHLDALHAALAELLLLPEARAALQNGSATADCLLDAFLALADAHGAFQEALLDLKRHAADARAALRRRDAARLASAARAQRSADKDIARLASSVRAAGAKFVPHLLAAGSSAAASVAEVEVSGVLAEAVAAVASASAAVFSAVESVSSAATTAVASSTSKKPAATLISLVTRSKASASSDEDREVAALDKLEDLDECIATMEAGSDKVFRSILQTRVALLNIHTQTC
ncbi:unnamed protein product [Urochloa decumbens]|uniref:Uncharacterized protein n=1 Tax=Urochloa decumbens TaxID=240449 RepID=A0ABC8ZT92_9POAL